MGSVRLGRDIDAALRKKGFTRYVVGKHVQYFLQTPDGLDSDIFTFMSHGMMGNTVGVELIVKMAHQCRLTKKQFLDFIDCTLNEKDYRKIVE